ncbi:MAG: hypothetical protein GY796_28950 [Chloroflexi bacterium]|nr:hypothetical protein [Chloroflexota bacterium]
MIRRIIGVIFIIMALTGWFIAYQGFQLTGQFIDNLALSMDNALQLTTETLNNVESTLLVTKQTVSDLGTTLTTMETTSSNIATSLDEAEPLLDNVSTVVSKDVPDSIESLQDTMPTLVEAASVIDRTLTTLTKFKIDETILGFNINYDLGIDYNPDVPFDAAVTELGTSLDGLPESLRELDTQLDSTKSSLNVMSGDMDQLAADMATLNDSIADIQPVLDEYVRIVIDLNDRLRIARDQINVQAEQVKQIFNIIFIWMGLFQLLPLYLGLEMVAGERGISQYVTEKEFAERMAAFEEKWRLVEQDDDGETDTAVSDA